MLVGVAISLAGIAVIGYAGSLRDKGLTEEEKKAAVKEFALKKGLIIAIFAGLMSACMGLRPGRRPAYRRCGDRQWMLGAAVVQPGAHFRDVRRFPDQLRLLHLPVQQE